MEVAAGLAVLRITIGLIFAAHGAQKAFGWWKGPGYAGWSGVITKMGFRPTAFWTFVSVLAELGAGLLLALGLLTPLAAAGLVGQGIVIIARVHWPNGFWNSNKGYEFPLVLLAGSLALALTGPGTWSLDAQLPVGIVYEPIIRWGVLVAGVVGSGLATWGSSRTVRASE
ncbi:MAG: DoxX family protein [Chloroflexota bacterium]